MARRPDDLRERARALRDSPTDAERCMGKILRRRSLGGARFRRQHPIPPYIADFAGVEHRLIIELDGGQHAENPLDQRRDEQLAEQGWRVLRFWNNDVLRSPDAVTQTIASALAAPPPRPCPASDRGEGDRRSGVEPSPRHDNIPL